MVRYDPGMLKDTSQDICARLIKISIELLQKKHIFTTKSVLMQQHDFGLSTQCNAINFKAPTAPTYSLDIGWRDNRAPDSVPFERRTGMFLAK